MLNTNHLMIQERARKSCRSWMKPVAVCICILGGCYGIEYRSDEQSVPQMSGFDARKVLFNCMQKAYRYPPEEVYSEEPLQNIQIGMEGFQFLDRGINRNEPYSEVRSYRFSDLSHMEVYQQSYPVRSGSHPYNIRMPDGFIFRWISRSDAIQFVVAVQALRHATQGEPGEAAAFADFQEKAKAWRALPVKPALPEEVQRFRVLAEDAFKNKNLEEAVEYYEQGLAVTPLWPEGHFNAALLYGEVQMYSQAVLHMKRYLELCPEAQNAKAAREKMYVWEEKAKKAAAPSSTDNSDATSSRPAKRR